MTTHKIAIDFYGSGLENLPLFELDLPMIPRKGDLIFLEDFLKTVLSEENYFAYMTAIETLGETFIREVQNHISGEGSQLITLVIGFENVKYN